MVREKVVKGDVLTPIGDVVFPIVRSLFHPSVDAGIDCGESMTIQSAKDECDINKILASYAVTGELPGEARRSPTWGDFSGVPDFHSGQNLMIEARQRFDALDPKVRKRFDNDPGQFLAFVSDEKNAEEVYAMGLAKKRSSSPQSVSPSEGGVLPPSSGAADPASSAKKQGSAAGQAAGASAVSGAP